MFCISLPSTECRIPHFHDKICGIDDLWHWPVLDADVQLAVEDDGFHCFARHGVVSSSNAEQLQLVGELD